MRTVVGAVAVAAFLAAFAGIAAAADEDNPAALAKALPQATVSLQKGLQAAAREGTPISAKFEIEDGVLQLSVYTTKGGAVREIIVDHKTGSIKKAANITDAGDLADAKGQRQAIAKAKLTLETAVANATKANSGYRAVSIVPALAAGVPMAAITLMKGANIKKVDAPLD